MISSIRFYYIDVPYTLVLLNNSQSHLTSYRTCINEPMVFATKVRITNAISECIYHIFIYLSLKLENKNKILWYRMVWSPSSVSCVCLLPSNMAEATQASPMMSIPTSTSRIAASYTRDQIPWNNSNVTSLVALKGSITCNSNTAKFI